MIGTIIGWARPLGYSPPTYHGVIEIELIGSVITACVGRWSTKSPSHFLDGRDRDRDNDGHTFAKCGACDDVAKEQRTLDGMRELARYEDAPLYLTDHDYDFDLSDLGGES